MCEYKSNFILRLLCNHAYNLARTNRMRQMKTRMVGEGGISPTTDKKSHFLCVVLRL